MANSLTKRVPASTILLPALLLAALALPFPAAAQQVVAVNTAGPRRDAVADCFSNGSWSIIGNGYAQLVNATDSAGAFSMALAYDTHGPFLFVATVSKGSQSPTVTAQADFARFILSPGTSSWSGGVSADLRPWHWLGASWGAYGYSTSGTANFQLQPDPNDKSTWLTRSAFAVANGMGLSLESRSLEPTDKNQFAVTARVGLATRTLAGDVWSSGDFIQKTLGWQQRNFIGAEGALAIRINAVQVEARVPVLIGHVAGLTNGQFIPSVSVGGAIDLSGSAAAPDAKK